MEGDRSLGMRAGERAREPDPTRRGPGRTRGLLRAGEMPGGGAIELPYTAVVGARPGPLVWILAARDGDEVHATLVALEVQRRLDPLAIAGCVMVLPVVNVPGFEVASRAHPLAPSYLGAHLDAHLFDDLTASPGFLIDLHSAGTSADTVDWTLHLDGDEEAAGMAHAFGSPLVYAHRVGTGNGPDAGLLDGALFTRSTLAGMPAILVEAGGGLPPDPEIVHRTAERTENVLRRIGSLSGQPVRPPAPVILSGFRIVTPSRGGIMQRTVELGERVSAGQVLARITDLHGEPVEELRAPVGGIILTASLNPAVGTGTWAFEIGW